MSERPANAADCLTSQVSVAEVGHTLGERRQEPALRIIRMGRNSHVTQARKHLGGNDWINEELTGEPTERGCDEALRCLDDEPVVQEQVQDLVDWLASCLSFSMRQGSGKPIARLTRCRDHASEDLGQDCIRELVDDAAVDNVTVS
jgi:hypothetical protein